MNAQTNFHSSRTRPEKLVVIGNGMAGCRAIEEILARDPDRYAITIFGAEPRVNYNRIMLSPVLAGEKTFDEIVINTAEWYAENAIELVSGDPPQWCSRSCSHFRFSDDRNWACLQARQHLPHFAALQKTLAARGPTPLNGR